MPAAGASLDLLRLLLKNGDAATKIAPAFCSATVENATGAETGFDHDEPIFSRYHDNDPNRPLEPRITPYDQGWGIGTIMLGCLAFVAVVFSIFYMMSGPNQNMASNERPAVTTNAPAPAATSRETTGSGTSTTVPQDRPRLPSQPPR